MTISRVQVYSSSRSCVLFKLTADHVLVFDWIAGSCQMKLFKTELGGTFGSLLTVILFYRKIFAAFVLCIGLVIIKLKIEGQTIFNN